jgi:carboxyl-terminal processing protease
MQQFSHQSLRRLTVLLYGFLALSSALPVNAKSQPSVSTSPFANNPKALVDEAWQVVNREYVDGTFNKNDWQQIRRELLSRKYTDKAEAYSAIRQSLKKLGDPYTRFMDPRQFESLTTQTNGEITGIGISLGETVDNTRPGQIQILEIVQKSPADKAGVRIGDRILSINGKSTAALNVSEAAKLIKGEAGQPLTVKLSRAGKGIFDITLKRAQIEVASVLYKVKQENQVKIGYIKLVEFSSHSSKQMQDAIQALNRDKVNALVLDLRGNPGGLLQNSIEIARMFLDRGVIVKTVDRQGRSDESRADQTAITELPLALLVDGNSASASEILAGAMKDNKRGTIVGSSTFGKALVQSVHQLSDKSGLAVTVAHYYTPNGTDIGHKGVSPDVQVGGLGADFNGPDSVATSQDAAYQSAVSLFRSGRNTAVNVSP